MPANARAQSPAPDDDLVSSTQLRVELGNISDMTLWRWLQDPKLQLPQPIVIRNRRGSYRISGWWVWVARSEGI